MSTMLPTDQEPDPQDPNEAQEPGEEQEPDAQDPNEGQEQEGQQYNASYLLQCIGGAIDQGAENAKAAESAEEYQRYMQGVFFGAQAAAQLSPPPKSLDPNVTAKIDAQLQTHAQQADLKQQQQDLNVQKTVADHLHAMTKLHQDHVQAVAHLTQQVAQGQMQHEQAQQQQAQQAKQQAQGQSGSDRKPNDNQGNG